MADHSQDPPPEQEFDGLNPGELFARALNTPQPSGGPRGWESPTVEELQRALPQYEILALAGRGGMGAVYRGGQKSLDRQVAIKVLPAESDCGDAGFGACFKREARAMALLSHPGIVAVHDAGETPEGLLYFAMDFIEGTDVQQLLAQHGRLSQQDALAIVLNVLDALAYAHSHGVIHRDIKPSNVMVDTEGRVKVADFGLAKIAAAEASLLTASDVAMGTPDFMAPEARDGAAHADHRADLYAVGVMLYQMLTGQLPRGRFSPPSQVVSGLDPRLDAIVDRALQPTPEARFASAGDFRAALDPVLAAAPPHAGSAEPAQRRISAKRLAIAAGVALAAALGVWLWRGEVVGKRAGTDANALAAESPGLASPLYPQTARWRDTTAYVHEEVAKKALLEVDDGWLIAEKPTFLPVDHSTFSNDLAVRVRFANRLEVRLRQSKGTGTSFYALSVAGAAAYISRIVDGERITLASPAPLARGFADGTEHELTVAAEGDRLALWLDRELILTATDTTFTEGWASLAMYAGDGGRPASIRRVEWAALAVAKPGGSGNRAAPTAGAAGKP